MEERPYDHANYMDYLRWCRRSTCIRFFTPRRISNGHKGGASGVNAIADSEDPFHASQLRTFVITPRAHLIHSVTDKLTILAKEAAAQKGCARSECHAFLLYDLTYDFLLTKPILYSLAIVYAGRMTTSIRFW